MPDITPFRAVLALIALCLAVYVPGMGSIPPLDRDEARYVQASKQMLETGTYVDIRYQETTRYKKPIGIYWLQTAAVALAGEPLTEIMWYRAVSVAGAVLAVVATFWLGLMWFSLPVAFLGAAFLALSVGLVGEAHMAKTDAALLATIVIMQGALGRIYIASRGHMTGRWENLVTSPPGALTISVFWLALGLGVLIKGPVALMVCGATIAALVIWDRSLVLLNELRPWPYAGLTTAVVLPWFLAIFWVTDGAFFQEFLGHDFAGKIVSGQEGHGAPFGYHTLMVLVFFFPGVFFIVPAVQRAWTWRFDPVFRFLLAWVFPAWLIIEIMTTKLPHYALPMYPALALLSGYVAYELVTGRSVFSRWPRWIFAGLWMLAATILPVAIVVLPFVYGGTDFVWTIPVAVVILLVAAGVFRDLIMMAYLRALMGGAVVMVASVMVALGVTFPSLQHFHLARLLDEAVHKQAGSSPDVQIALAGYHEPSAVFLLGTDTVLTSGEGVAHLLATPGATIAAVEAEHFPAFEAAAARLNVRWFALDQVRGYNYTRGDWLDITLVTGMKRKAALPNGGKNGERFNQPEGQSFQLSSQHQEAGDD